ncbi:MAG TPA: hypothetical protein VNO23_05210 [Candidatus Binatia bacterium]|nr:hypothetical protein [Candidatus Binatia bacterium]
MTTRTQIPVGRPVVAERPAALGRTLGALLLAQGLIAQGLINEVQLAAALEEQKQTQEKLGAILVRRGDLTEDQLVEVLARRSQVPVVAIPESIPAQILGLLPASFAAKYEAVPLGRTPSSLTLAMVDPTNVTALDEAAFRTGLRIIPVLARPSDIRKAIERYYSVEAARLAQALGEAQTSEVELVDEAEEQADVDVQELRASADDAPIVRLLNMVFYDAIR